MSIFINSCFKSVIILLLLYHSINTVVSTANKIENNRSDAREKSFKYSMNSRGPRIEP